MVSIREIKRIFSRTNRGRQLPIKAIEEFALRSEKLLKKFAEKCDERANNRGTNSRLTPNDIKLAYLHMVDDEEKGNNPVILITDDEELEIYGDLDEL